jgi:hypothetical protein
VTRVTVITARCGARRVAGPLIGGLFALLAAGCDPSNTVTGEAVPGPALVQQVQTKPVAFQPVIGAPAKVSTKLNELLVASAGQKNIPVVPPKDAEYTVRGYLVAAADPKGTKLSYIWDVSDKANKRKRIQGEELIEGKKGGDPWTVVDDAAMQRVAAKAIEDIAAYLPKGGDGPAVASSTGGAAPAAASAYAPATTAATPAASANLNPEPQSARATPQAVSTSGGGTVLAAQTEQPAPAPVPTPDAVALVPPVSGAPGDGSQSLTAAMRRHLQSAGVKLVDNGASSNTYTVKGSVEMGSPVDGQQPITIHWMVVDPAGKTMDKAVVQRNKVAEGSLDGPWGQVADLAAGEAAKSLAKLIGKPAG